ncbi:MAG: lytic transglycosylase domain-containing protein [Oscillospiraceae bacterium]|nr:lytic transglycosylase domain-containing protein [Oscillospiraceae bacterium]
MIKKQKSNTQNIIIKGLIVLIIAAIILLVINLVYYGHEEYLRRNHPIRYSEIVENSATEYNIDKYLIYAIIKTESGFKAEAVSNVGARGLMQIMSDTFDWLNEHRLLDEDLKFDDMFIPEYNIRYGTELISYHIRHYKNTDNSLAAYHAGDGAVDKWLKDKRYSEDGKTLKNIPSSATAHYIKKVNKAYEIYTKLYGGE